MDNSRAQDKIYKLHQYMQEWTKGLPLRVQQRLPCELLADLAGCLAKEAIVFEIVNSLMDIQHMTETDLHRNRTELKRKYSERILALTAENLPDEEFTRRKNNLHADHRFELRNFDISIVKLLDAKVVEQQQTLELAGVPGFKKTSDSLEITVQMCLLDFIIRSGKVMRKL